MGVGWSKEKQVKTEETSTRPAGLTERQHSSKRSFSSDNEQEQKQQPNKKKNKKAHFRKKDSWAKKEGGNKKAKGDTVQTRPERLGPRDPRIPKKKVALLVGFNGTGYQGMQM